MIEGRFLFFSSLERAGTIYPALNDSTTPNDPQNSALAVAMQIAWRLPRTLL